MDSLQTTSGFESSELADSNTSPNRANNSEFFTVGCPGMGCHQNCPLQAEVVDGAIVKVRPQPIPGAPEETHACLRGIASYELPNVKTRLQYPKKRVGERGSGQWQQISWEEALDTIADKMLSISDEHGPQAIEMAGSGSSSVPLGGLNAGGATQRLANLFGCTEVIGWPVDGGPFVAGMVNYGFFFGGANDPRDWVNAKTIIIWGENMAESAMRDFNHVMQAQAQGTQLIVIGPTFDATAAKADWWIPLHPASDGALALGMLNLMIERGLYDIEYTRRHTVGPFLVRDDNGEFLRESDINPQGSAENFVVWDQTSYRAMAMPPRTHTLTDVEPALHGQHEIAGIGCHTAFQLLANRAAEYPPETTAEICELPVETINKLATTYGNSRPSTVKVGIGLSRTFYGDLNSRAILAMASITGDVGVPGGGASGWARHYAPMLNGDPVYAADARRSNRLHISTGHNAVIDGDIKAMLVFASNPLNSKPNANTWINQVIPKLELLVVVDIVDTWTAQYADIVLPGTTIYERTDLYTVLGCTVLSQQAIGPMYEAKSDHEICTLLAQRLGLGEYFTETTDQLLATMLDHPTQTGITLEKLKMNNGIMRAEAPENAMISFADKQFFTPSGRIEFYAPYLGAIGEALPCHKEPPEGRRSALAEKYPLQFYTGRRKFTNQSQSHLSTTKELCPKPLLRMNPNDAASRELNEGDLVKVFNDRGLLKVEIQFSQALRPGSVWIEHGWKPEDFVEGHYQNLLLPSNAPDKGMINPAFQIYWGIWQEYAEQAASPGLAPYGLADQLFDCQVEVEKTDS